MQTTTQSRGQSDRQSFSLFLTYCISYTSLGMGVAALGPMLPFLADNVGVSIAQISFLFASSRFGYLIGSAGGGRLYDRFKGHTLMILALCLMIITMALVPLIPLFSILLLVMFFFGMGMGILDVGGNVQLLWIYQSRVGPFMNALHFAFGVGALLAPIIIHNVMAWSGGTLTWPYWVLSFLFLPGLIGLFILKSPENPEKGEQSNQPKPMDTKLVLFLVLLSFIAIGMENGYGGWIFTYATELGIANEAAASYMNSIFWASVTVGRLISILLARKLSPSKLLIGNLSLAIFFLGLILIWPTNTLIVWIVSAGLGLALSSVFPTLLALGETRMKITGAVTGLFFLGSGLGATLIPLGLGQIFEYIGSYQIMLTLFVIAVIGLILMRSLLSASKRVGDKVRT